MGTKYFISYNPWDDKDEKVSLQTMSNFIKKINADGVVLDTRAEGSETLQKAANMPADDAKAYANLWDNIYRVSFEPADIATLKRMNDIFKASGTTKRKKRWSDCE